ncbi:MAG: hypothetical protein J3Q66DRAFT_267630, partial [Benniella sp.]
DCLKQAITMSSRNPLGMTGGICLKSPPKTTIFPPKATLSKTGSTAFMISLSALSNASNTCRFVCRISSPRRELGLIMHDVVSSTCIGIENLECAVRPPFISNAAIPDDAT